MGSFVIYLCNYIYCEYFVYLVYFLMIGCGVLVYY